VQGRDTRDLTGQSAIRGCGEPEHGADGPEGGRAQPAASLYSTEVIGEVSFLGRSSISGTPLIR